MPSLLRDWKPGKRLSAKARRIARRNGHLIGRFAPEKHDVAEGNDFPTYWTTCQFCEKFISLNFDDPENREAWGPALKDECPGPNETYYKRMVERDAQKRKQRERKMRD